MTSLTFMLVAALAAQSPSAEPAPAQAQNTQEATDDAESGDAIICKRVTSPGTRFKERKCAKASDWAKQERHYVETTRELKQTRGTFKGG